MDQCYSRICLAFISFCLALATRAQETAFDPSILKTHYVAITSRDFKGVSKAGYIRLIDQRYDQSKLGYIKAYSSIKLVTKDSLAQTVERALNGTNRKQKRSDTNAGWVVVIRHLWLDGDHPTKAFRSSLRIAFDCYEKNEDGYIPRFRLDTLITSAIRLNLCAATLVADAFAACANRMNEGFDPSVGNRLTAAELELRYRKPLQQAFFTDSTPVDGVYLSYKDFLQKKPAYTDFRLVHQELSDEIYINDNGKEKMLSKTWGYVLNGQYYIRLHHSFFPMVRQQNGFDLLGYEILNYIFPKPKPPVQTPGDLIGAALSSIDEKLSRDKFDFKPMQLNMETGKPYSDD